MFTKQKPGRVNADLSDTGRGALEALVHGWGVVPVHCVVPVEEDADGEVTTWCCSCKRGEDCPTPGGHPLFENWEQKIIETADEIGELWTEYPVLNVGVRTGVRHGVALQIEGVWEDPLSVISLREQIGFVPRTPKAISCSDAETYFFLYPHGYSCQEMPSISLGPDVTLRQDHDYVILPPSVAENFMVEDEEWVWEVGLDEPLAELPEALVGLGGLPHEV